MNCIRRWAWVGAVLLWGTSAGATTLVGLDLPTLAERAEAVVRGKVQTSQSRWTKDGRRIVTEVKVEVSETLKGAPPKVVTLVQPGGRVGDIGQRVDGIAAFEPGEEVVLFLERQGADRFQLTGMGQGKYRVQRSSDQKATFAIPEPLSGALLVDGLTGQPLESARRHAVPLEQLQRTVKGKVAPPQAPAAPVLPRRPEGR